MKRCPTCQRTFDDNMKFCQADGTPLVADDGGAAASGGGFQEENFDPMKTVLAQPPPKDLPPPSPFGAGSSEPPRPADSDLSAPSFGDLGGSSSFEPTPEPQRSREPTGGGAFGSASQSPAGGFAGDAPRTPSFQEPEPAFGQQPFGNSPSDWTPPPAPAATWGNQGLGQNTPFSPPPAGGVGQGQNQTMAIVSLVCGILSCLCCVSIVTGPLGLVLGYMAKNNIRQKPMVYGGMTYATWGMITGGIGTALVILLIILQIFFGVISNIR